MAVARRSPESIARRRTEGGRRYCSKCDADPRKGTSSPGSRTGTLGQPDRTDSWVRLRQLPCRSLPEILHINLKESRRPIARYIPSCGRGVAEVDLTVNEIRAIAHGRHSSRLRHLGALLPPTCSSALKTTIRWAVTGLGSCDRDCFEAILFRLVTGCSWDVAGRLGKRSDTTLQNQAQRTVAGGSGSKLKRCRYGAGEPVHDGTPP